MCVLLFWFYVLFFVFIVATVYTRFIRSFIQERKKDWKKDDVDYDNNKTAASAETTATANNYNYGK